MSSIDQRLRHVATKQPLVFEEIDFTINDVERVRASLEAPLEYAQRVEAAVVTSGIETLMPRRDRRTDEFLELWTIDEHGHARALAEMMHLLDLEPKPVGEADLPVQNRFIGMMAGASESMHDVIMTIWGIVGAMNEHLAMAAYTRMDVMLREQGEVALHETLFRRLRAHESAHKSFYAAVATEGWDRLASWQRRMARFVVTRTYAPVGAGAARDRPAMARTIHALAADTWEESIVEPVQAVADRIFAGSDPVDPFVRRAFEKCLATDPVGVRMLAAAR